jgi:hypothetical protein
MNSNKSKALKAAIQRQAPRRSQQERFAMVVQSVANRYGIKLATVPQREKNPYEMSSDRAVKIALEAGIITPKGNLTRRFK